MYIKRFFRHQFREFADDHRSPKNLAKRARAFSCFKGMLDSEITGVEGKSLSVCHSFELFERDWSCSEFKCRLKLNAVTFSIHRTK